MRVRDEGDSWRSKHRRQRIATLLTTPRNALVALAMASLVCNVYLLATAPGEPEKCVDYDENIHERKLTYLEDAWNDLVPIRNTHFPLEDGFVPIVLYVYNRPEYLRTVLRHLRAVRGIERTLLIVSHDGVVPETMDVVREEATFCQVKQIVHPRMSQHNTGLIPLKRHWWWLMERVWDTELRGHNGHVVFIEEDHAVTPDFYATLHAMLRLVRETPTPDDVWGVSMSPFYKPNMPHESPLLLQWNYGFMNTGYAFNRTVWNKLAANADYFWTMEDGWDYSLFMLQQRGRLPDVFLAPALSRVKNVGVLGVNVDRAQYAQLGLRDMPVNTVDELDYSQLVVSDGFVGTRPRDQKRKTSNLD